MKEITIETVNINGEDLFQASDEKGNTVLFDELTQHVFLELQNSTLEITDGQKILQTGSIGYDEKDGGAGWVFEFPVTGLTGTFEAESRASEASHFEGLATIAAADVAAENGKKVILKIPEEQAERFGFNKKSFPEKIQYEYKSELKRDIENPLIHLFRAHGYKKKDHHPVQTVFQAVKNLKKQITDNATPPVLRFRTAEERTRQLKQADLQESTPKTTTFVNSETDLNNLAAEAQEKIEPIFAAYGYNTESRQPILDNLKQDIQNKPLPWECPDFNK